eukprot:TRINITY_DN2442_c0_g1_i2.p1 TRINITY_DN2442_c0_g1~~TRINITY_DN2442_c0_g1_i2.p1  ORF type:complete len:179 (-),score=88.16 TRINITY_DN2442_c0_g1_i2:302-838(-)
MCIRDRVSTQSTGVLTSFTMARFSIALALLLCTTLFLAPAFAQEDADTAVHGVEDDVEKEAKDELDRMDGDKDGKISLDEVKAYFRKEFYSDEDMADSTEGKDGKPPTAAEIAELVNNDATEFLTELDKNKDGHLDLEELKEQYKTDGEDLEEDDANADEDGEDEAEDMGDLDPEEQE